MEVHDGMENYYDPWQLKLWNLVTEKMEIVPLWSPAELEVGSADIIAQSLAHKACPPS